MFIKILYILLAIAVLLVLIMVHEFGHYLAGKIFKFKINEFSIGFGKSIYSKTAKNGEKFSIRIFPLGGYCAFEGEDAEVDSPGAFNKQKPWKRLIVLFSGVFFNFIFGILTSVVYLSFAAYQIPEIAYTTPGNTNQFMIGDIVKSVNGKEIQIYRTFNEMTEKFDYNEEFVVTVDRNGEIVDLTVKKTSQPAFRFISDVSSLSGKVYFNNGSEYVSLSDDQIKLYLEDMSNDLSSFYYLSGGEYKAFSQEELASFGLLVSEAKSSLGIAYGTIYGDYNFFEAVIYSVPFCIDICGLILSVLGGLFTGATPLTSVGGTITAVSEMAKITSISLYYLLYLIPMLSMNLALFNILPIPALDGARMVFVGIEWIRGKPINRNVEGYIHFIGLIVLFALVIFLDVFHLIAT